MVMEYLLRTWSQCAPIPLPATTGTAFVAVQYLDPTHRSALVDLLVPPTTMPVAEVTDGVKVEANHVYVILHEAVGTFKDCSVVARRARRISS